MPVVRMREALNQAMAEEMRRDERVFIMGEDVGVFQGAFKVTEDLLDEFGEKRVRDTPISENTIVGAGVGAAMAGLRPVVEIPGLLVACPSTPADGKGLLKTAIRDDNPVIFIEHETLYGARGEIPETDG